MPTIESVESRVDAIVDRIDKLEHRQDDLEKLIAVISAMQRDIEHQSNAITRIEKTVQSLADEPKTKWDTAVKAVITGIVSFLIGIASSKLL